MTRCLLILCDVSLFACFFSPALDVAMTAVLLLVHFLQEISDWLVENCGHELPFWVRTLIIVFLSCSRYVFRKSK